MVGGKTPYKGSSVLTILATMATDGLVPLRALTPEAPESFAATVERCLAQDKALRFPSVAHLAHALMPYASRRGRVSIEQILATLDVDIPDDPLSDARQRTGLAGTLVRPALPPAPLLGPRGAAGPQFSAPSSGALTLPPSTRSAIGARRVPLLLAALAVLFAIAAFATWRALR